MKATSTKSSSMELTHRQLTLLRKKEQMRQQQIRKILLFTTAGLLAVVLFYVLAAAYYRTRFLPRTSINGIAVGGRRVEDAEKSLKNSVEEYTLTVTLRDGEKEMITADDIELTYISGNETAEILSSQNPLLWGPALFGRGESHTVETEFHFDSGKLKSSLASFPEFQKEKVTEPQGSLCLIRGISWCCLLDRKIQIRTTRKNKKCDDNIAYSYSIPAKRYLTYIS